MAESYGGNLISFSEDGANSTRSKEERVNGETWEPLEKLAKGEVSADAVWCCCGGGCC